MPIGAMKSRATAESRSGFPIKAIEENALGVQPPPCDSFVYRPTYLRARKNSFVRKSRRRRGSDPSHGNRCVNFVGARAMKSSRNND